MTISAKDLSAIRRHGHKKIWLISELQL